MLKSKLTIPPAHDNKKESAFESETAGVEMTSETDVQITEANSYKSYDFEEGTLTKRVCGK